MRNGDASDSNQAFLAARLEHAEIAAPLDGFVQFVKSKRLLALAENEASLGNLQLADLYIAFAALSGVPGAVARLRKLYASEITYAYNRIRPAGLTAEDAEQMVWERLLTTPAGRAAAEPSARLASYSGRGRLNVFVRVTATRLLINAARDRVEGRRIVAAHEAAMATAMAATPAGQLDMLIEQEYQTAFLTAVKAAVGKLRTRQRMLLRCQFTQQLSIDEIGTMYGVHRATAARWLGDIRQQILAETRRHLRNQLGLSSDAVESILKHPHRSLDQSLSSLFL